MLAAFVFLSRRIRPGFTVAALAAVLLATPFLPASFWNRMATIGNEQEDKALFTGSTEARRLLLQEGLNAFLEHPLTGVGAGQFKNYNPPGRRERWREAHNAPLQVAADLGLFGFAAFAFLILCGIAASVQTRRLLSRSRRRGAVDRLSRTMTDAERAALYAYATALTAGLIGWFVCALFASVAYSWTFYIVLALLVATRDLVRTRLALAQPETLSLHKEKSATWTPQLA
jgi:O-antigen ligase